MSTRLSFGLRLLLVLDEVVVWLEVALGVDVKLDTELLLVLADEVAVWLARACARACGSAAVYSRSD
eukprot:78619-Amphidinium_carterae.1